VLSPILYTLLAGWLGLCGILAVCMFGAVARYRIDSLRLQRALAADTRAYRREREFASSHL
jgi:hypothetical protein